MTGVKHDSGKPPMDMIPREAMVGLAQVLGFGAGKYGRDNWRGGLAWSRLVGAALRHITAWNEGEDKDPETGLSHVDHALACLSFLSSFEKTGGGQDDRFKPAKPEAPAPREETHAQRLARWEAEVPAKEPEIRVGQSWRSKDFPEHLMRVYERGIGDDRWMIISPAGARIALPADYIRNRYTLVDTTLEPR